MRMPMPRWSATLRVILVAMASAASIGAAPPATETVAGTTVGDQIGRAHV